MARLVFLCLTLLLAALVTLTAAADQQWVLWVSQAGTRWHTVALFPTDAACRAGGQALVRNAATGFSRAKIVDDRLPQSVGIAAVQFKRIDPADPRVLEKATTSYRAALERVLSMHERELARRIEMTEMRKDLYSRGVLSEPEFKVGQQGVVDAQKNVDDARQSIVEADRMNARIAQAGPGESRMVQVPLYNAACWPVGVTPQ